MKPAIPQQWDMETDVLVVGYGYAGAATAIYAHDAGSRVTIIEKLHHGGGLSITSGGGLAISRSAEDAFAYLQASSGGRTSDAVLRAFAEGLCQLTGWLEELAHEVDADINLKDIEGGSCYAFPGHQSLGTIKIAWMEHFQGYPWMYGLRGGARLFKVVADNVEKRQIPVLLETPARRLVTGASGEVLGVVAERDGREFAIAARRAVVLATGGFEHNEEMKRQYMEAMPIHGITGLGNTGDGIHMAQDVGAALWHMWHFHGSYGFKFPDFPFAFRHPFSGPRQGGPGMQVWTDNKKTRMPFIIVDQDGRRFMNEYPPVPQDTGARPLQFFDAERREFPRIPCYLIYDELGRLEGPMAFPIFTEPRHRYEWSQDNRAEIERGWVLQGNTLAELAATINARGRARMSEATLQATLDRWAEACRREDDPDFGRPGFTMFPLAKPPFYALEAWPIVSNTQGGPQHDERQRVLDPFGQPIARLYATGELGSIFGHLYLESGNVAECFIGARAAASDACELAPWC